MEQINIKVNGNDVVCRAGQTIYEVVTDQGIDHIPVLCHSPGGLVDCRVRHAGHHTAAHDISYELDRHAAIPVPCLARAPIARNPGN